MIQELFTNVIITTVLQVIGVLGIFYIFGFVLHTLQQETQQLYQRMFGWHAILWTAWFGTPVHELGHVFFAKIFRHKVNHISLFKPNKLTGTLGHVEHSYNPKSLYQLIGNFFVGVAPLITGPFVLLILLYFIHPNGALVWSHVQLGVETVPAFFDSVRMVLSSLLDPWVFSMWQFWLYLYLSFCVISHMAPSAADRKAMWHGLVWIIILLFIFNLVLHLFGLNATGLILQISAISKILVALLLFAIALATLHFLLLRSLSFVFIRRK